MQDKYLSFGEYIKKKRLSDPRNLTLQDVAGHLGISISYISSVENRIKRPFDGETLVRLGKFLDLSPAETAVMFDIAARETHEVPFDIEDTFAHERIGDLARYALRLSKTGVIREEDWKNFVRQMEEREKK